MNIKDTVLRIILGLIVTLAGGAGAAYSADMSNPKREFRGAWLHVIGQSQYMDMPTNKCKSYIQDQLDKLQAAGCNAVIFQVRPCADAMYPSALEPWSQWLTGRRGKAPVPEWDPLEFTLQEAHNRGMEFHAWLNPYRVSSNLSKDVIPADHDSKKHPERYFKYDGKLFFDPAYQENRDFICKVVDDIVTRYDVDAIHIDDYFYPYPAAGNPFNADAASFAKFGNGMKRNDWRRHNVDLLIEQLSKTIKDRKPWVRFGVSPFGIWRNKRNDPRGSESTGLQNYDDLYADVLLWSEKGWIDYLAPQLYWSLDLAAAPSRKLVKWWNDNVPEKVQLYIGQDTKRTMDSPDPKNKDKNELDTKVRLSRQLKNVDGNVWWHGYWVTGNYKGVADSLANKYQSTIALPPMWGNTKVKPRQVSNIQIQRYDGKTFLEWDMPEEGSVQKETDAVMNVVYGFFAGEDSDDLSDPQTIIAVTPFTRVLISDDMDPESVAGMTYVVTTLDRMNRESLPKKLKVSK